MNEAQAGRVSAETVHIKTRLATVANQYRPGRPRAVTSQIASGDFLATTGRSRLITFNSTLDLGPMDSGPDGF
jgi:hypothetical protein